MTHRDYKELSAAIAEAVATARRRDIAGVAEYITTVPDDYRPEVPPELEQLALRLATHCASDNPRFDRAMFLRNAGLGHLNAGVVP